MCKFCNKGKSVSIDVNNYTYLPQREWRTSSCFYMYDENKMFVKTVIIDYEQDERLEIIGEHDIKFCPFCGRPLTSEFVSQD